MLIGLAGLGIGVPKTSIGVGAAIGKLYFRENPQTVKEKALTISDLLSVGQKSGAFLMGGVTTKWFDLDPIKENALYNFYWLLGKKAEIKISGVQLVRKGSADIEINAWDKNGQVYNLLNRKDLQTDGTQFAELKVRGVIQPGEIDSKGRKIPHP